MWTASSQRSTGADLRLCRRRIYKYKGRAFHAIVNGREIQISQNQIAVNLGANCPCRFSVNVRKHFDKGFGATRWQPRWSVVFLKDTEVQGLIQCCSRRDKLRDYKTDPQESEANAFASELLMPTYLVRPIIESNEPSLATARGIASEFNVSVTAAAIRIFLETRHECFLVLSRHGQGCWWMSGSERYGIWLESKQPLQPRSLAYHIDEGIPVEPETVPSESWFLHLPSPENVEVTEDSMQLGQTGFVLSFLTLGDAD
jgi:hypothetical protein